jgi:hypothetical protein
MPHLAAGLPCRNQPQQVFVRLLAERITGIESIVQQADDFL